MRQGINTRFWLAYFGLMVLLTVLGWFTALSEIQTVSLRMQILQALDFVVGLLSLGGLYGFIKDRAFFNANIWRLVFLLFCLSAYVWLPFEFLPSFSEVGASGSELGLLLGTLLYLLLIAAPSAYALFKYGFRSPWLWR